MNQKYALPNSLAAKAGYPIIPLDFGRVISQEGFDRKAKQEGYKKYYILHEWENGNMSNVAVYVKGQVC